MLTEQIKSEGPHGHLCGGSEEQYLEARGGKRPSSETQLLKPAHLAGRAPCPSHQNTHSSGLPSPSETAALEHVSHDLGVQKAQIEAQVEQLKAIDGVLNRWKAGDTVERTAVRFQVHPEAVELYFRELARDETDGKRERTMLKKSSQPARR